MAYVQPFGVGNIAGSGFFAKDQYRADGEDSAGGNYGELGSAKHGVYRSALGSHAGERT